MSDDTQAVVIEVSEAVSAALDEFHFSMEAFGNAIVFGKSPHTGNFLPPTIQSFGQCDQRSKMAMGELGDEVNEVPGKWSAMNCLLMFFTHEIANALKLIVNGSECRMVQEELIEAGAL